MFKVNNRDTRLSLSLTLNIFHAFFYPSYSSLRTGKCWLGMNKLISGLSSWLRHVYLKVQVYHVLDKYQETLALVK